MTWQAGPLAEGARAGSKKLKLASKQQGWLAWQWVAE